MICDAVLNCRHLPIGSGYSGRLADLIGAAIREIETDNLYSHRGEQWQTNSTKIGNRSFEIYAHSRRRLKPQPEDVDVGLCAIVMGDPNWDRTVGYSTPLRRGARCRPG